MRYVLLGLALLALAVATFIGAVYWGLTIPQHGFLHYNPQLSFVLLLVSFAFAGAGVGAIFRHVWMGLLFGLVTFGLIVLYGVIWGIHITL